MKTADTLLMNGRFITLEKETGIADAVAVCDGRILYVGDKNEAIKLADEETTIIDLNGKVAAPSFIESHTHPVSYASVLTRLNCRGKNTESLKST